MKTRKKMTKGHLNRKELIEASKKAVGNRAKHLAECAECRKALEFLLKFPVAGQLPLADAPTGWINKAVALAEKKKVVDGLSRVLAHLIFDSWTMPEPVGVRGEGAIEHRRLRYRAAEITIDIRAEQARDEWHMVAQAIGEYKSQPFLVIGKKEYYADEDGLFQWADKKPPRHILLKSKEAVIEFPELSWKKTRKN
jgi:hypothetical protein